MDDDVVVWLILLLVVGIGGWFLGVRGYFKSRRALREIADLRRQIATATFAREVAPEPTPTSVPTFIAEPISEPEPLAEPELVSADYEPAPEPVAAMPEPAKRPDFETLLTTRWGVWLGSGALLLAGVFLIRYAVDEGLLGPATRCVLAVLLGVALLVGAEWLRRREASQKVLMDRAAPALAAGGVAILFGAAYGAGVLYDLVPPLIGFALMAAASLIGMAVSLRHGQLVGAVGIAGAFVSPALVQTTDPSLPGLFLYLLFVTAAALAVVRYTAWIWLGWATTIAGAVWVLLGLATGAHGEIWAAALFVPAAAALNLALLPPAVLVPHRPPPVPLKPGRVHRNPQPQLHHQTARHAAGWITPGSLEAVTSGKVGAHDITGGAPRRAAGTRASSRRDSRAGTTRPRGNGHCPRARSRCRRGHAPCRCRKCECKCPSAPARRSRATHRLWVRTRRLVARAPAIATVCPRSMSIRGTATVQPYYLGVFLA